MYKKKYNELVETIAKKEIVIEMCINEYKEKLTRDNITPEQKKHCESVLDHWTDELIDVRAIIADHKLQEEKSYKEVRKSCEWMLKK